ncbi:undecaprenyl diphosphate synthase family protein, partial [Myxococcota bacterium]|nr:undecaprenyl diphosphate synthase family protein [Myxococcota bacterium]
ELRLSNFLLWQSAWSELYFSDVLWPDFSRADFDAALDNFAGRERRFGGLGLDKIQDESEVFELGVLPEIDNSEPEED